MFRYFFANSVRPQRKSSYILSFDGDISTPIGRPAAGSSADTRFFGHHQCINYVVKRPHYKNKFGSYSPDRIRRIEANHLKSYQKEMRVWNEVYPDRRASLFTEQGLRLVLPYLPGKRLSAALCSNRKERCKQLLSVAKALKHLYHIGYKYTDFNTDNVLIDKQEDGGYKAYLIDFACMQPYDGCGLQELNILNILFHTYSFQQHCHSLDGLIAEIRQELADCAESLTR